MRHRDRSRSRPDRLDLGLVALIVTLSSWPLPSISQQAVAGCPHRIRMVERAEAQRVTAPACRP